jgi:hypothetical protein
MRKHAIAQHTPDPTAQSSTAYTPQRTTEAHQILVDEHVESSKVGVSGSTGRGEGRRREASSALHQARNILDELLLDFGRLREEAHTRHGPIKQEP